MTAPGTAQVPRRVRVVVAVAIGLLAALYVRAHGMALPGFTSDFDQVWAAARAWLEGRNPYAEVGPAAPFRWKWPLYYPLPAVLVVAPLAKFPVLYARMLFAGLSAGVFSYAIFRHGWWRWPILLSISFYVSVDLVQWSPLLAAAYFLPALGAIVACKPNFALPPLLAFVRWRDVAWLMVGAAILAIVTLGLRPSWPGEWLASVREAPHFRAPFMRPLGFLLLAAALRWRRPEARWLLALSLVPQAPSFYDQLLLVAVCSRWIETAILSAGTWALFFYVGARGTQPDYAAWGALVGNATVWLCYLPCLVMVLLRPNEGEPPAWLSRMSAPRPGTALPPAT